VLATASAAAPASTSATATLRDFLTRPIEGDWPYLWLDATYVKVREAGRIVPVAVTIAVGVNSDGRREVLGMAIGASVAETFWLDFLRSMTRRGLRGVKLVISDAHEGLKAAVTKVLRATWQRCRVHFMRNATAHAGKTQRRLVSAWIGTAFAEADAPAAHAQWRRVADQLRPKVPKLAELMDAAEHDVLAYMDFPREHRAKRRGPNLPQTHDAYGLHYRVEKIAGGRWKCTVRSATNAANLRADIELDTFDIGGLQGHVQYGSISPAQRATLLDLFRR